MDCIRQAFPDNADCILSTAVSLLMWLLLLVLSTGVAVNIMLCLWGMMVYGWNEYVDFRKRRMAAAFKNVNAE